MIWTRQKNLERKTPLGDDAEIDNCMNWVVNDYSKNLIPEYDPIRGLCIYIILMLTGFFVASIGIILFMIYNSSYGLYATIIYICIIIYLLLEFSSEYFDYFVLLHQPKKNSVGFKIPVFVDTAELYNSPSVG